MAELVGFVVSFGSRSLEGDNESWSTHRLNVSFEKPLACKNKNTLFCSSINGK